VNPDEASLHTRDLALKLGLPIVGFAAAAPVVRHPEFITWLEHGYAGDMDWLARDAEPRRDPRALLASAKTVIVAALSYAHPDGPDENFRIPAERLRLGPRADIARYARGADYHHVLKRRLQRLGDALEKSLGRDVARLVCVDTAPLLERDLAAHAGLGFVAKNTMLIAPGHGSYLNLGALLVDVEMTPGTLPPPRCGSCRACLDACPTGAFVGPYVLDARRCISYLTIENRGPIPHELRPLIGARVFGCDVCQEVCPFNGSAGQLRSGDAELAPRGGYSHPPLLHLLQLGAAQFRKWQQKSALRRIHRPELLRNVAVALGNTGGAESIAPLAAALAEPSALVRAHVVWALREISRRLGGEAQREAALHLQDHRAIERDPTVLAEL
jgi:epoxyqueuosine reductase